MSQQSRKAYKFVSPVELPEQPQGDSWSRAQDAIEKLKDSYIEDWAPTALNELDRVLTLALSKPDDAEEHLRLAYRMSHDMKGQGATFGFCLISDIGATLCSLTFNRKQATQAEIQVMLAHVEAARKVLLERLDDPESEGALAMMAELQAAVRSGLH